MEHIISQRTTATSRTHTLHGITSEYDTASCSSEEQEQYIGEPKLIAIIGDEDTCVGFILAGIGELDEDMTPNYFVVDQKTDDFKLELAFLDILERPDIGLVLITREAADKIAPVINQHKGVDPSVMVIPGHNGPYEIDLPLAVKYIEEKRMAHSSGSRRTSMSSATSIKTVDSHHGGATLSRKVSTQSLRSVLSSKSLNLKF